MLRPTENFYERWFSSSEKGLAFRVVFALAMVLFANSPEWGYAQSSKQLESNDAESTAANIDLKATNETIEVAGLKWLTDYYTAYRQAAKQQRILLVSFVPCDNLKIQHEVEEQIATQAELQTELKEVVLCRVPVDVEINSEGESKRLLEFGAFCELCNGPGYVLVDLRNRDAEYYGCPVTVLPFQSGKYYRWSTQGLAVALDLPGGTLTQRTLIWAVRMHPEQPQSTGGQFNKHLATGAAQHASYQANIQQQGHQNFETRFHRLSAAAGSGVTEVCAESWPGQDLIDSCVDCVASWRHSSGHWRAVSRPHRAFGYDIRQGRNGIWYGTGLFAD